MLKFIFYVGIITLFYSCNSAMDNKFVCDNYGNIEEENVKDYLEKPEQKEQNDKFIKVYNSNGDIVKISSQYITKNAFNIKNTLDFSSFKTNYDDICNNDITKLKHYLTIPFAKKLDIENSIEKIRNSNLSVNEKLTKLNNLDEETNTIKNLEVSDVKEKIKTLILFTKRLNIENLITELEKSDLISEEKLEKLKIYIEKLNEIKEFDILDITEKINNLKLIYEKDIINKKNQALLQKIAELDKNADITEKIKLFNESLQQQLIHDSVEGLKKDIINKIVSLVNEIIFTNSDINNRTENLNKFKTEIEANLNIIENNNEKNDLINYVNKGFEILQKLNEFYDNENNLFDESKKELYPRMENECTITNNNTIENFIKKTEEKTYSLDLMSKQIIEKLKTELDKTYSLTIICNFEDIKLFYKGETNDCEIKEFKCNQKISLKRGYYHFKTNSNLARLFIGFDSIFDSTDMNKYHNLNRYKNDYKNEQTFNLNLIKDEILIFSSIDENAFVKSDNLKDDCGLEKTAWFENEYGFYRLYKKYEAFDANPFTGDENVDIKENTGYYITGINRNCSYNKTVYLGDIKGINWYEPKLYVNMNDIYIIGSFSGTLDFNFNNGVDFRTSKNSQIFLLKGDSNLKYNWVNTSFSPDSILYFDDRYVYVKVSSNSKIQIYKIDKRTGGQISSIDYIGGAVVSDEKYNTYLYGSFSRETFDFNPTSQKDYKVCDIERCNFITKFDKSGRYLFTKINNEFSKIYSSLLNNYSNNFYTISFPVFWKTRNNYLGYDIAKYLKYDDQNDESAYFYLQTKQLLGTFDDYLKNFKLPDSITIISQEVKKVNKIKCKIFTYKQNYSKGYFIIYEGKKKVHEVNILITETEFDFYKEMIKNIINSFVLIK